MARQNFGGFGGGNMQQLMRQAQKMQQQLQEAQEEGGSKKAIQDMEAALKLQMARYEYLIGRHALLVNRGENK